MYIDYKMPAIIVKNGKTYIKILFYKGDITTEDELDVGTGTIPVTRYRRTSKIKTINHILNGVFTEAEVRRKINLKLKTLADERGFTVVTEQSDV